MMNSSNKQMLSHYMGLAWQLLALLTLTMVAGYFIDKQFLSLPVFVWVLPLLSLIGTLIKIVVDTTTKNK